MHFNSFITYHVLFEKLKHNQMYKLHAYFVNYNMQTKDY